MWGRGAFSLRFYDVMIKLSLWDNVIRNNIKEKVEIVRR